MKRLIITEEEKRHIQRMHNIISEGALGKEPVIKSKNPRIVGVFYFNEGKPRNAKESPILTTGMNGNQVPINEYRQLFISDFTNFLRSSGTLNTLDKFLTDKNVTIPNFIEISVGTSSTPGDQMGVTQMRRNFVEELLKEAFNQIGYLNERISEVIMNMKNFDYKPSTLDLEVYDQRKITPKWNERFAAIKVYPLTTVGHSDSKLDMKRDELISASGLFNVDEEGIVNTICSLGGYSDLVDINRKLNLEGGLEWFINTFITDSVLPGGSDTEERQKIVDCINEKSNLSKKGNIATVRGDKVVIMWP